MKEKKEHPILFSTEMVESILEGRKTMTRRILKVQPEPHHWSCLPNYKQGVRLLGTTKGLVARFYDHFHTDKDSATENNVRVKCPYGKVGDILWVRETWCHYHPISPLYAYKADGEILKEENGYPYMPRWKPSIYMPRAACRIFLEITDIRVERLQDISEDDAIKEGVQENVCSDTSKCPSSLCANGCSGKGEYFRYPVDFDDEPCYSARESFETLWQSINGEESWNQSPWVWVISFRRIESGLAITKQNN